MRFPTRFTSDFQLGVAARVLRTRGRRPLILKLSRYSTPSPEAANHLPSIESAPRVVWIGGAEPLDYPDIPRYTNALAKSGREVFLQTDGKSLRRRVHEFQPSARFRFALRFDPTGAAANPDFDVNADGNADVIEAIRIARLSGFLTVGIMLLRAPEDAQALIQLHAGMRKLDLDGNLILPAASNPELNRALANLRSRLLDGRWSGLSRLFDEVELPQSALRESTLHAPAPRAPRSVEPSHAHPEASPAGDLEEGAQAG
jgi:hypothetical protein